MPKYKVYMDTVTGNRRTGYIIVEAEDEDEAKTNAEIRAKAGRYDQTNSRWATKGPYSDVMVDRVEEVE